MATHGVEFANVSFTAGGRQLLRNVSLRIEEGTTTALLGRSGAGKTTLLRTVNALVRPTSGRVLVDAQDVTREDAIALRSGIGYVIQQIGLFPHISVERNVGMALELAGRSKREIAQRAAEMLGMVGLPGEYAKRYPRQLSGGQQQRVGVARALANEPKVLLMDEPFGALDPLTRAEMQTMVRDLLKRTGVTALIVTHDLDEALYLADRVVLMEGGAVVADVARDEVRSSDNEAVRTYVAATHREVVA
ncbi:MAG TPA: ATP-binding cassette domain-containing protein [Acidobacteriaceae bacterium]|nr:ATP-binding cassette domain-containing protein [Acidobacteriaceae bacterium]